MCTPASREARCGHFSDSPLTKVGAKNSFRPAEADGSYRGGGPKGLSRDAHQGVIVIVRVAVSVKGAALVASGRPLVFPVAVSVMV